MKDILYTIDVNSRSGTDFVDNETALPLDRGSDALFVRMRIPDCQILVDRILVATVSGEICPCLIVNESGSFFKYRGNRRTEESFISTTSNQVDKLVFRVFYHPIRVFACIFIHYFFTILRQTIQLLGAGQEFVFG